MKKNKKMTEKIQRKRYKLLQLIHSRDTSTLRAKVAYILNHYPATRNSDKLLTIKLWQSFYPDKIIDGDKIRLDDIIDLPKSYDMQRYRAEIQNTLGLFLPTLSAQKLRRHQQDAWKSEMNLRDAATITVFTADANGRDDLVLGSLWIYDSNREHFEHRIASYLIAVRDKERLPSDFDFSYISEDTIDQAQEFFKAMLQFNETISFKALIIKNYQDLRMDTFDMYENHIFRTIDAELNAHRIFPPKSFAFIKAVDDLPGLSEWERKQSIKRNILEAYEGDMHVDDIYSLRVADSPLLQVTELFTNAVNLALEQGGENPARDYFAGYVLGLLNINPLDLSTYGEQDWVTIETLE